MRVSAATKKLSILACVLAVAGCGKPKPLCGWYSGMGGWNFRKWKHAMRGHK